MSHPAILALEDGSVFHGTSAGVEGLSVGEVVFNTAMTGYQEILTDPSYSRQLVTLTHPHIGNVGANEEDMESSQVFAAGLIVREISPMASNWRSEWTLPELLQRFDTVAISEVDTRAITRRIRDHGAQAGCILAGPEISVERAIAAAREFPGLKGMDLARLVSTEQGYPWNRGKTFPQAGLMGRPGRTPFQVVAYDFGIKYNILRLLVDAGCQVQVVRAEVPAEAVLEMNPDGVLLANGPGDPEPCDYAIDAAREIMARGVPVFGICLGFQLMALASGARTVKMKFGHHGANHPVQETDTGRVLITSQNHGFAVEEQGMPSTLRVTHRSLFDGTIQGLERTDCPAFSFQGHPEASPGPHDLRGLFERFAAMMQQRRDARPAH